MGQQSRAGHSSFDRSTRGLRLHDLVATRTCQLHPNLPDHFEMFWHILQYFRNILTQGLQSTGAVRAGSLFRQDLVRFAREMRWQRLPRTFRLPIHIRSCQRRPRSDRLLGTARLQFVQLQL